MRNELIRAIQYLSRLKQGSTMNDFCHKKDRGLKALAAHLYPKLHRVPPTHPTPSNSPVFLLRFYQLVKMLSIDLSKRK